MCIVSENLQSDLLESATALANKEGLKGCKIILLNKSEVTGFTLDTNKSVVKTLTQRSGTKGFALTNIKQLNDLGTEFVPKEDDEDGHKHALNAVLRKPTREILQELSRLEKNDEGVIAIVRHSFEGVNGQDQMRVYGLEKGLKLSVYTTNTKEYHKITLSTKESNLEPESYRIYDEGDVANNLARFTNNFTAPS